MWLGVIFWSFAAIHNKRDCVTFWVTIACHILLIIQFVLILNHSCFNLQIFEIKYNMMYSEGTIKVYFKICQNISWFHFHLKQLWSITLKYYWIINSVFLSISYDSLTFNACPVLSSKTNLLVDSRRLG